MLPFGIVDNFSGSILSYDYVTTCDHRVLDQAPEDVLPACQLTMMNLQVDFLDLYLLHAPFCIRKGSQFPFPDEDRLMYNEESISHIWKVI